MITKLEMKNFRQHEDLTITFKDGLNVIRGANEAGKSTLIEAILYALFGAKSLRDTLAETVTWGKKETELAVRLEMAGGIVFSRSKAGAEVIAGGKVIVTGQNEVTGYATNLMGADAKTASNLMLSDQTGLRGALDEGPAAVSGLMSKLADFDLIDRILAAMSETLLTGAEAPIREKLIAAEKERDEALAMEVPDHLIATLNEEIAELEAILAAHEKEYDDVVGPALNKSAEALREAEALAAQKDTLKSKIDEAQYKVSSTIDNLEAAQASANLVVDEAKRRSLRAEIDSVTERDAARRAYAKFLALPKYPGVFWDSNEASFREHMTIVSNTISTAQDKMKNLGHEIRLLEKDIVNGGVCPSCGTDISKRADIIEKNTAIQTKIAGLTAQIDIIQKNLADWVSEREDLKDVELKAHMLSSAAQGILRYLNIDDSVYPVRYTWAGGVPSDDDVDAEGLKAELKKIDDIEKTKSRAEGQVQVLSTNLKEHQTTLVSLQDEYNSLVVPDVEALKDTHNQHCQAVNKLTTKIGNVKYYTEEKKLLRHNAALEKERRDFMITHANQKVAEYQADIESLAFNNALVKKMRALKPGITDHLWNIVLAAVSNFFTQLRGENSVVTKDSDGFKVNGRSVKSLSGSTIDVLALSVRVALTKTFIPNSPLLVLDEPAHGCDTDRTASMLGFLASIGFTQLLVASHDELSEAVADNVITLGV